MNQEGLIGDWAGARTRWKDKGVVLDSSLTQFYQGVNSGGTETGSEYNATAQAKLEFDFGKLAGCRGRRVGLIVRSLHWSKALVSRFRGNTWPPLERETAR